MLMLLMESYGKRIHADMRTCLQLFEIGDFLLVFLKHILRNMTTNVFLTNNQATSKPSILHPEINYSYLQNVIYSVICSGMFLKIEMKV